MNMERVHGPSAGDDAASGCLGRRSRAFGLSLFDLAQPLHRADGPIGFGRLRFLLFLRFLPFLYPFVHVLDEALVLGIGIEHFEGAAAGIDFVVMAEIGKALENAEELLVPCAAPDLYIAGAALRAEEPET